MLGLLFTGAYILKGIMKVCMSHERTLGARRTQTDRDQHARNFRVVPLMALILAIGIWPRGFGSYQQSRCGSVLRGGLMNFPILSIITFLPFVASVIMLLMPADRKTEVRGVALATAAIDLLLSGWVYLQYLLNHMTGYQFIEKYTWLDIPSLKLNISLHFGVDGMSAPLVLLTGIVMSQVY